MPPKIIHLCWFSKDPYPLEIKICLASWKRVLPDYKVRVWTYEDAKAIGCKYIDQALSVRKWAFAADVVRFYAVYKEGGVYMDSDIYLRKRFDRFIPETGCVRLMSGGKKEKPIMVFRPRSLSVQREMISVRRSLSIIRNGTLSVLTVRWTRRFLRISCEVLRNVGDMSARRRNSIWMVYIYILLIGCRQEAASSIVRMLLGNIGCTEAGVTISLAGNWNVRSSISVMR